MEEQELSCTDCRVVGCARSDGSYPAFCPTAALGEEGVEASAQAYRDDPFALKAMQAASAVNADAFANRWCRVEETLAFLHHMGWQRIGIASCAGLAEEGRTFARILRVQGYQPFGICCKVGAIPRGRLGARCSCCDYGEASCNPLLQAQLLAEANTEVNVVIGLCAGHDMLFSAHSAAPVITLVVKDRPLAHNSVGALHAANSASFYGSLLAPRPELSAAEATD